MQQWKIFKTLSVWKLLTGTGEYKVSMFPKLLTFFLGFSNGDKDESRLEKTA